METNIDNTISIYNNYQEQEIKIEFDYGHEDRNQESKNEVAGRARTTRFQHRKNYRDIKIFLNKIFGAYLLGYNMINIHSKNPYHLKIVKQ